jgi:cytochrome oxidase Cu insertion factor (SCO1/SenC/PrrC family)
MSISRTRSLTLFLSLICIPVSLAIMGSSCALMAAQQKRSRAIVYACPMHPEVTARKQGRCPKCGMNLRARNNEEQTKAIDSDAPATDLKKSGSESLSELSIPDVSVVDQNGRKINFYKELVQGKTVAINFIFTTCTTICPPLTATFRRVQQNLGERVGRDIELISISVDPATDVPERLKDFAAKFKAGPGWTFVTGSKTEIDRLLSALGAYVPDKNDHTPMMLIGNDTVHFWTRTYGLAPATQITNLINEAADKGSTTATKNHMAQDNQQGSHKAP